jgi:lipoprotein-releasing system ATP-binding protein
MKKILSARKIFKTYGDLQVLKNINIDVNDNEIIAIVGPSGAGKTTLLHILGNT